MNVAEIKTLRWMIEVTTRDNIRNEFIKRFVKMGQLNRKIQKTTVGYDSFGAIKIKQNKRILLAFSEASNLQIHST